MAGNIQIPVEAKLRTIDAIANSLQPTLRAFVEIQLSGPRASVMHQRMTLPEKTRMTNVETLHINNLWGGLYWRRNLQDNPGTLLALAHADPEGYLGPVLSQDAAFSNPFQLLFSFSRGELNTIEDLRAGGDAKFSIRLGFRGIARQVVGPGTLLEPCGLDRLEVADEKWSPILEIPKSRWVENYLPGLRLGSWKTFEIPWPTLPPLGTVDEHLAEAQRNFDTGEWRACVVASRVVVQELEPHLRERMNPALGDRPNVKDPEDAATKAGDLAASFSSLVQGMLDFQKSIFGLVSTGAHPIPPEAKLERPDAELALGFALTCRRYVGQRFLGSTGK